MFWPSGLKRSFGGFCGSMFIVGSGLSTLETAANPFIATCGPAKYSELRLTLAQAFQAVGTVVAPVLASQVIFKNVDDTSLQSVQWVYLGIGESKPLLAAEDVVVNESTPLEGKSGLAANDFLFGTTT